MDDRIIGSLLPKFISIPATPFLMGTQERDLSALAKAYGGTRESYREESPQHRLLLPAFEIAQVPVTNVLYATFIAATGARAPVLWHGRYPPDTIREHPVVDVSWEEAQTFCVWLHTMTDIRYRLPTEAEWEHAARGTDGRTFPWGMEWNPSLANTSDGGGNGTTPVGTYPAGASPYGCLDMAGNVWEWTTSLSVAYLYDSADGRESLDAPGRRILRGGCYANPHGFARCACRFRMPPSIHNEFLGFRLARSLRDQKSGIRAIGDRR